MIGGNMALLILSDKRAGHENQSLAFAKHLGLPYELIHVSYAYRIIKLLSYLLDYLGLHVKIFHAPTPSQTTYEYIVATGSSTYYPAKYFAKRFHAKTVALMLPKNYRNDFDKVFVMEHDVTSLADNMITLPVNICYAEPKGVYIPSKQAIGIIIGGDNKTFKMNPAHIKQTLKAIKQAFQNYEIAITTSPRTPKEVERMIEAFAFDYTVIYSKNKTNPIADFLFTCKHVFITEDSTSMISEAACFGTAGIEIITLETTDTNNKYRRFVTTLAAQNYVHLYEGTCATMTDKFPLRKTLIKVLS